MRPSYGGPGSASSRWKPTQDPGKTAPSSNIGGNRLNGSDTNSKGANTQNQQHSTDEEKKE